MVNFKRSEYRHAYLRSPTKFLSEDYEQKSDYRSFRRQVEHQHHSVDWETKSNVSDELSEQNTPHNLVPHKVNCDPPHIQKFKAFQKYWAEKQKEQVVEKRLEKDDIKNTTRGGSLIQIIPKEDLNNDVQSEMSGASEEEKSANAQTEIKNSSETLKIEKVCPADPKNPTPTKKKLLKKSSGKPKRPVLYRKIPKSRLKSAPVGVPSKKSSLKKNNVETPIFVAWAAGDKENEMGCKRSYNIKCPVDVYPAALRAAKRREDMIKQKQQFSARAPIQQNRTKALFNDLMNRQTSNWDTEYRRNFVGFGSCEYAKHISPR